LIFGPGLVEAYELESSRALYPRIILGEPACQVMTETLRYYGEPVLAPQNWELLRDQDGETFVDYLGSSIVDYILDPAEDGLRQHRDAVAERLTTFRGDRRVWEKYRWSAEYHNAVCDRFFSQDPDRVRVEAGAIARRIDAFVPAI
jgi:hypothetical protein